MEVSPDYEAEVAHVLAELTGELGHRPSKNQIYERIGGNRSACLQYLSTHPAFAASVPAVDAVSPATTTAVLEPPPSAHDLAPTVVVRDPEPLPATPELTAARETVRRARRGLIGCQLKQRHFAEQLEAVHAAVDALTQQVLIDEARVRMGLYLPHDPRQGQAAAKTEAAKTQYERAFGLHLTAARATAQAQGALDAARKQRDERARQAWVQATCPVLVERLATAIADAQARAQASGVHYGTVELILVAPIHREINEALRQMPASVLEAEACLEAQGL